MKQLILKLGVAIVLTVLNWQANAADNWLVNGERLAFAVSYWGMDIGNAEILYQPMPNNEFELVARAWTNPGASSLYRLRDRVRVSGKNSTAQPFMPDEYLLELNENDFVANKHVEYLRDGKQAQAAYHNRQGGENIIYLDMEPDARDMLSSLYAIKVQVQQKLEQTGVAPQPGDVIKLPIGMLDNMYNMELQILERQQLKTKFGTKSVLHIQPVLIKVAGDHKSKSNWHVWVTDDGQYLPVKVSVDMNIGKFRAELTEFGDATLQSKAPAELPVRGEIKVGEFIRSFANPVSW